MRRLLALLAATALAAFALSGCGDDSSSNAGPISGVDGTLEIGALDIEFDRNSYSTPAGEIEVEYVQQGSIIHTLVIEGIDDFKLEVSSSGDVDRGSVELEPGTYVMFCDVAGHREAGMEATLEVN